MQPEPEAAQSAERMSAYLDAELDPTAAAAFEGFLSEEPQARAELDDLRKVVALVGSLREEEPPPDFTDKVTRRLRRRQILEGEGGLWTLLSLPFQVLSVLVVLAIAGFYMLAQLEGSPRGTVERDAAPALQDPDATDLRPLSR
jgi:anti-sigma factor RsiW